MASRIDSSFIFFIQLVKSAIDTMMNQDQRTHLQMTSEISMDVSYPSKKKRMSSLLNNYHIHFEYQFSAAPFAFYMCDVNQYRLSSYMYTLPISNQQRHKAFLFC